MTFTKLETTRMSTVSSTLTFSAIKSIISLLILLIRELLDEIKRKNTFAEK